MQKGIDKRFEVCYFMQAVREGGGKRYQSGGKSERLEKFFEENQKKGLTNSLRCGILDKLSARTAGTTEYQPDGLEKKFKKT